jgi:pimeloyl-ACP methyl ester carboxylesterase
MTAQLTVHRLEVPGGTLHYEVRGSGPLLLVVGQPMTSEPFAGVADQLAADHTVVTYDPRGIGRSTVSDPTQPVTPQDEADDLSRIIAALGTGPADVVGSSGGAVAGLALVQAHPEQVRTLIAHEPPVTELLPDAARIRAAVDGVEDTYRAQGAGAAWGAFISLVMHQGPVTEDGIAPAAWPPPGPDAGPGGGDAGPGDGTGPGDGAGSGGDAGSGDGAGSGDDAGSGPAVAPEQQAKQEADDALFFLRMLKPFIRYVPDIDRLRTGGPRIVPAFGGASGDEIAKRATVALAERLGTEPRVFPGHHGGFMDDPEGFAAAVRRVLADG